MFWMYCNVKNKYIGQYKSLTDLNNYIFFLQNEVPKGIPFKTDIKESKECQEKEVVFNTKGDLICNGKESIEKYNYKYLLFKCLEFQTNKKNKNDYSYIQYLNLLRTGFCKKDTYLLTNKILKEICVYDELNEYNKFLNLCVKAHKYLDQQEHNVNIYDFNKICYKFAEIFEKSGNYYCALKWIKKLRKHCSNDEINDNEKKIQENEEKQIQELETKINKKRIEYVNKFKNKKIYEIGNKPSKTSDEYYINKKWYNDYKSFINNKQHQVKDPSFPREIDNYELLSGKEMLNNEQYILNESKEIIKIKENEWNNLKDTFGYIKELKVDPNYDSYINYKILLFKNDENNDNWYYYFRPKYLRLKKEESIYSYIKQKYKTNEFKMYCYKNNLNKKERKELLFDFMYFFLFTGENFLAHSNLLVDITNINRINENQSNQLIFIDFLEFIQIQDKTKCFLCQQSFKEKIQCKECTNNFSINTEYVFCSNSCLNKHKDNYHKIICMYQSFQYNTLNLLHQPFNYNDRKLVGLINLRNTCYMNAGLQCLLHCEYFISYLLNEQYNNEPLNAPQGDMSITKAFSLLAKQIYTQTKSKCKASSSLSPKDLRNVFVKKEKKYNNNKQHDSPEFISDFLDLLSK